MFFVLQSTTTERAKIQILIWISDILGRERGDFWGMIFSHCLHTITSFSRKKSSQAKLWASHLHPNVDCKWWPSEYSTGDWPSEYSTGDSFVYNFFNNYAFVNTVTRNKPKHHHRIKNLQGVTGFCLPGGGTMHLTVDGVRLRPAGRPSMAGSTAGRAVGAGARPCCRLARAGADNPRVWDGVLRWGEAQGGRSGTASVLGALLVLPSIATSEGK